MSFELMAQLLAGLFAIVVSLGALGGIALAVYSILGAPLRRQQRARLFLDLLERTSKAGQSPEDTVVAVARCGDSSLGWRFRQLAEHIEGGLRLGEASQRVPYFLPATVAATLRAGERLGDVRKVLPACQKMLVSGNSQVTSAINFLFLLLPLAGFSSVTVLPFMGTFIAPKIEEIARDLLETPEVPSVWSFLMRHRFELGLIHGLIIVGLVVLVLCYLFGPRLRVWFSPVADHLMWLLPWRRKRMLRDFSLVLSVLLDAGLPEPESITLAAACTANVVLIRRGEAAVRQLEAGEILTTALSGFDADGEFRWRLANAAQGHSRFTHALTGWHESLEARAYQSEQAVSQVVTTGVVLFNGLFAGLIAVGVFQVLTRVVMNLALW